MMRIFACLFFCLWIKCFFPYQLFAQSDWRACVRDAQSLLPLSGATVHQRGTHYGVSTDVEGCFVWDVSRGTSPEIRFLGYRTKRIPIPDNRSFLWIDLEADALALHEITVKAFGSGRSLRETSGAVAYLSIQEIQQQHATSLAPALNRVAGVRMEESGFGGSSRLSIRGSLLRSPFGIRNVKMYWNGIPLTEPAGTSSRFNSIDPLDIGSLEIIKGPAGSLYGAGTGGVLLIESRTPEATGSLFETELTSGAYGLHRYALRGSWSDGNTAVALRVAETGQNGYREHQQVNRRTFHASAHLTTEKGRRWSGNIFHYDGFYQLPGPLTLAQSLENPRMAIPFSKDNDAHVALVNTGLALSHRANWTSRASNETHLGIIVQDKWNPSGTSAAFNQIEVSGFHGWSLRSVFRYIPDDRILIQAGVEAQSSSSLEKYYVNDGGSPGAMKSDIEAEARTGMVFAQADFEFGAWIVTSGLSLNVTEYDVVDRLGENGLSGRDKMTFGPTLAPRMAILYKGNNGTAWHSGISYGFSTPTQWEIKTLAGVNNTLRAEQGLNAELGWKWFPDHGRFGLEWNAYRFGLRNALLPQFTAEGLPYFSNAGAADQYGIEFSGTVRVWKSSHSSGQLWLNGAWNQYRFTDYVNRQWLSGEEVLLDYSGNAMPGIAPFSGSSGLDLYLPAGLKAVFSARYMDRIPLNDANAVYSRSWLLFAARIDADRSITDWLNVGLRGGVENITNVYWDNLLALNGSFGRYFNPGQPRHAYFQVRLSANW